MGEMPHTKKNTIIDIPLNLLGFTFIFYTGDTLDPQNACCSQSDFTLQIRLCVSLVLLP